MKNTAPTIAALLALTAIATEAHTVTFRRLNGTVLQTAEVAHGADATALPRRCPPRQDSRRRDGTASRSLPAWRVT